MRFLGLVLFGPVFLFGHHNFTAEFDIDQPVRLEGKITRIELINPHAWIHLDVLKPDGAVEKWLIEGGSPNILIRRGVTKDSVPPGTEVVVEGFRAKNGLPRANGYIITLRDGTRLFLGSSAPAAPARPKP